MLAGWLARIITHLRNRAAERRFRRSLCVLPLRIIVGAGPRGQPGWVSTDINRLDLLKPQNWARYLRPGSIDALLAEHVWEHLSPEEALIAAQTCYKYLRSGGYLRIAVPDGLHPSSEYINAVKPGGSGAGASDHRVLYDYRSLAAVLGKVGFKVQLHEYFDENGQFHSGPWRDEDGRIARSSRHDDRNVGGGLNFTSLIVDAVKPLAGLAECQHTNRPVEWSDAAVVRRLTGALLNPKRAFWRLMGRDPRSHLVMRRRADLICIGTDYGGWVVPAQMLGADSICYCFGCGEDISFDLGLIARFGCHVFGFDPTPRSALYVREATRGNDKYHFCEIGLWDQEDTIRFFAPKDPAHISHSILNLQKTEDYFSARVRRLSDIMRDNQHSGLDLLKIDIEGAEYRVIAAMLHDGIRPKIFCVEFHEDQAGVSKDADGVRKSVRSMVDAGYLLVAVRHRDNYTFVREVGDA